MKKAVICFFFLVTLLNSVSADDSSSQNSAGKPAGFEFILGPRVGVNYINTTPEEFSEEVGKTFEQGEYYPVTSLFGLSLEQRILLGQTKSHFAFQEVIMVGGLEQSIALPSISILIAYRGATGFEFGAGATFSMSGVGVIAAVGWTFSFSGVYIPLDISVIIPNKNRPMSIAMTTGFNFRVGGNNKE